MSIRVIIPSHLTLREWVDFMTPNLEQYGNLARLDDEKEWRAWAATLLNLPAFSGSIVPNPYHFDDWQTWVQRLNENLAEVP